MLQSILGFAESLGASYGLPASDFGNIGDINVPSGFGQDIPYLPSDSSVTVVPDNPATSIPTNTPASAKELLDAFGISLPTSILGETSASDDALNSLKIKNPRPATPNLIVYWLTVVTLTVIALIAIGSLVAPQNSATTILKSLP